MQRVLRLALFMMLCCCTAAWAQVQIGDIPYANIEYLEPERPLWEYISAGGFILAVLALGFMSSRRVKDA